MYTSGRQSRGQATPLSVHSPLIIIIIAKISYLKIGYRLENIEYLYII